MSADIVGTSYNIVVKVSEMQQRSSQIAKKILKFLNHFFSYLEFFLGDEFYTGLKCFDF